MTRTDQSWACWLNCVNGATRTIWDGDQILYEVRAPAVAMEQDVVTAEVPDRTHYGRVGYVHGPGIDRPLAVVRMNFHPQLPGTEVVLPHLDWRGSYETGTFLSTGQTKGYCITEPAQAPSDWEGVYVPSNTRDQESSPSDSISTCVEVSWPAQTRWMTHQERPLERGYAGPRNWMGSLIEGGLDVSGQMYMRNRYYDPKSGKFTQEDPIGLAGGLNVYGFANGDPVTYSDPYGLEACPDAVARTASTGGVCPDELTRAVLGFLLEGASRASTVVWAGVDWLAERYGSSNDEMNRGAAGPMIRASRSDNSRPPRNARLAGQNHPTTGIPFDANGLPDFSGVSARNVDIDFSGNRSTDVARANRAAGYDRTPANHVWHHHQNGRTMQLVPEEIHRKTGHTGGHSIHGGKEEEE